MKTLEEQVKIVQEVLRKAQRDKNGVYKVKILKKSLFKPIKLEQENNMMEKPKWLNLCGRVATKLCKEYDLPFSQYRQDFKQDAFVIIAEYLKLKPEHERKHEILFNRAYNDVLEGMVTSMHGLGINQKHRRNLKWKQKKGEKLSDKEQQTLNAFKVSKWSDNITTSTKNGLNCVRHNEALYGYVDTKRKQEAQDALITIEMKCKELSEKHQKILQMMWEGYKWREISRILGVDDNTIWRINEQFRNDLNDLRHLGQL